MRMLIFFVIVGVPLGLAIWDLVRTRKVPDNDFGKLLTTPSPPPI